MYAVLDASQSFPEIQQNPAPPADFAGVYRSDFVPAWWAKNRHLQTILPKLLHKPRPLPLRQERFELDDGDFVDLSWCLADKVESTEKLAVLFHGLEGSAQSHYLQGMLHALRSAGWSAVVMHFRGCSGEPNRLPRAYHSGDTEDALKVLALVTKRYPAARRVAIGFSLGANMLLKLLGENPQQAFVEAAVAVSPPIQLAKCADAINQGFSALYQRHLLRSMRRNFASKLAQLDFTAHYPDGSPLPEQLQSFRQFDEHVTAPLHGFAGADDYYARASAIGYLKTIRQPTLILHAIDDPFMADDIMPSADLLSDWVRLELSEQGGHVGFLQGLPWQPKIWLEQRVLQLLDQI